MKLLLVGNAMDNLSGQPMSTYEMAREFSKEHDVTVCVLPNRWSNNIIKQNLESFGVKCVYDVEPEYDLIIASEWCPNVKGKKINIVRSEYDEETPIEADFWVCIRPSIQEHIIKEHGIPEGKTKVIYNGVDRERFKSIKKTPRDHFKIVAPCTIDSLRKKWLNHLISTLNPERHLYIYGVDYGITLDRSPFLHMKTARFDIETAIADADLVSGILLGRVNLEANSCGVLSEYYHPVTLERTEFLLPEEEFDKRHNIKNTVKYLLEI